MRHVQCYEFCCNNDYMHEKLSCDLLTLKYNLFSWTAWWLGFIVAIKYFKSTIRLKPLKNFQRADNSSAGVWDGIHRPTYMCHLLPSKGIYLQRPYNFNDIKSFESWPLYLWHWCLELATFINVACGLSSVLDFLLWLWISMLIPYLLFNPIYSLH